MYLEVLLSVENYALGLHLPILDVNLVSTKDNWDVFTNSDQISVPVRNILIGNSGCDIKHDNSTLSLQTNTEELVVLENLQ